VTPNAWNYRLVVVKKEHNNLPYYTLTIREVYYNQGGHPFASSDADVDITISPLEPEDPIDELKADLEAMLEAFKHPVLNEELDEVDRDKVIKLLKTR